jgi:hypothetical protein
MWRYKLVALGLRGGEAPQLDRWEAGLNELGVEGWEAVAIIEHPDDWAVLLKMPHEVGTY